jgi:hypothetical protein
MHDVSHHSPVFPCSRIISASGYCKSCNIMHGLPMGTAYNHCRELIQHFLANESIDLTSPAKSDPRLSTAYLFGEARGKMFGILECRRADGSTQVIRAFSGQYNGLWEVPGWAPPLFDTEEFRSVNDATERHIKKLGRLLESEQPNSPAWLDLRRERRNLSQGLMRDLHAIYRLTNFHGTTSTLADAYNGSNGMPTGTGDCCAPKLLNFAAAEHLTPVSLAEFYWGLDNKSGSRRHGRFYPSCREKCQPILGYLLCGLKGNIDAAPT